MTQDQFDYFYKEFEQLNHLLDLANIQKSKKKTKQNVFKAHEKMNDYNDLKKKIIKELSEINPDWTKNYNSYDDHPVRMLPFPEIYDLAELDKKNFDFFYNEFEKLDNLFHKAYHIDEDKKFDEDEDDDEEENIPSQLDEENENKLKGFISGYYSIDSVIEYNKQEEKIIKELAKINQKWLESKNERQLIRYEGDLSFKVEKFQFPYIFTLFEKLVQYNIEIQKLRKGSYNVEKNQFDFDQIKKQILDME
jgi:hypothetical protein